MIEELELRNFQKHRKLQVSLDSNVTCFIGPTDAGKSSIIRALRWAMLNKATPKMQRRGAKKSVRVRLRIDGKDLVRQKGKGNTYSLDGKKFEAIGTKVPEGVSKLLGVEELNFQRQLELHFWFSKTPGQVSAELNEIVNLGTIDDTLSLVSSDLRRKKAELSITESRLKEAKFKRQNFSWCKEFAQDLEELKHLQKELRQKESQLELLGQLTQRAETAAEKQRTAQETLRLLPSVKEVRAVAENQRRLEQLESLTTRYKILSEKLCHEKSKLQGLASKLEKAARKRCPKCGRKMPRNRPSLPSSAPTFT